MEELQAYDVIDAVLQKQDTCSILDMNKFKENYNKKHPYVYVSICRDDIDYVIYAYKTEFWYDDKKGVFRRQESIKCPACGDVHRKYPNVEAFEKLKKIRIK
jgi:hypothetical protein